MAVLKWGLIGAGDIARKRVAPALLESANCELVSIARSRAELAQTFAEEFGARKCFADWRELIADDEIDAVYIATPVYLHAEQTIAAARAGKHVLCEKPMALSVDECDSMIAVCRENDVKLGLAYYRRFYPVIARVKEIIRSGELGGAVIAQMNAFEYFKPSADDPRAWLLDQQKSGGGPMMDFGCHRIEVLTDLFGEVGTVEAVVSNRLLRRSVEDTATAIIEFETGCSSTVTVTHAAIEPRDTLDIYGTKGSIHIPVLNKGEITIVIGGKVRRESCPPAANVHLPLIDNFTEAILGEHEPLINGDVGLKVAAIVETIYAGNDRSSKYAKI